MNGPLRIVACTLSMGTGNGISRMDEALARGVDRERFHYTCCHTDIARPETAGGGDWYVPVSASGRFERLCALFADADIVQFNGGFDPVACEAAAAAQVPTLLEVMHQCDRGQRSPRIHATVCVSQAVRRVQPVPEKTLVIPNGIDVGTFSPTVARPADRIIFLEVAQRGKAVHFHLDDVADALLALDGRIALRLAGSGQTGPDSPCGRVRFLGLRTDMPDLYSGTHFLVLASKEDAFGLACAEAMACGCLPIVAADGGMAEIVEHGRTGWLFDPKDPGAFIATVREALALEAAGETAAMRRRSRRVIRKRFSMKTCIEAYEALYARCARENGVRDAVRTSPCLRRSAEGLLGETIMAMQARLDIEAILAPWLDTLATPLTPLGEPGDAYWLTCRAMLLSLFTSIAQAGYAPLAATLGKRLAALYPLPPQA
ncbi:glycosyltransferase family 4 protein [Solidesulfovibrio alcoholivorans]|uniref:glycosyltransferase family 4 protein n=1 Tax=Solidesulfovibrio alcoholivorans TaxID=81406 RepID=UPI000496C1A9|nr:glycosyltransferase family 4 protein [Solidesulfovibrio alcoholivorans]